MDYLITFLEGIISFISPCMLPMLPVYISYFAGGSDTRKPSFLRAFCFVLGFTFIFCLLGLFAGSIGAFLYKYNTIVNIICGIIVILLGLSYLELFRIPMFRISNNAIEVKGVLSAFIFGIIFSLSLTPCVGTFLSSALMMASYSKTATKGVLLLLCYSFGIGIPFLISAFLIEKLNYVFTTIKKNYKIINTVCGIFLIIVGLSMIFGFLNKLLSFFS